VRHAVRCGSGGGYIGGIVGYPLEQLQQEVAFIAYYFHWPLEIILDLQHTDRRGWVEEISAINRRLRDDLDTGFEGTASWSPWTP
jgi:hypothetical protein